MHLIIRNLIFCVRVNMIERVWYLLKESNVVVHTPTPTISERSFEPSVDELLELFHEGQGFTLQVLLLDLFSFCLQHNQP